jgi:hypothetical protein
VPKTSGQDKISCPCTYASREEDYVGMEVKVHTFLTSVLHGGEIQTILNILPITKGMGTSGLKRTL